MRKLLLKLAFLFIPILSALVLVNYNIDPGGKYSKQNFYKLVADELAKGKTYSSPRNSTITLARN